MHIVRGEFVNGTRLLFRNSAHGLENGLEFEGGLIRWFPNLQFGKFWNDRSVVQDVLTARFGVIDREGEIVLPLKHTVITDFRENRAFTFNGRLRLINSDGEIIRTYEEDYVGDEFHEGLAILSEVDDATHGDQKVDGFVDRNGKFVIPPMYRNTIEDTWIHSNDDWYSDGLIRIRVDGLAGYIDGRNHIVIEPQYEMGTRFSEGLAGVRSGNRWGFIDRGNRVVIPMQYENVQPFSAGLASVCVNGKWGVIHKSGQYLLPQTFDGLGPFHQGYAPAAVGDKWGLIDTSGKFVVPPVYDAISYFHEGIANIISERGTGVMGKDLKPLYGQRFSFGRRN